MVAMCANVSVAKSSFTGATLARSRRAPVARAASLRTVALAQKKDILVSAIGELDESKPVPHL